MKPSSELFDLIRTLTKSEKRFFKLHSSLQSGDKNYVRLFDIIEKMEVYDEELIKKTFRGEKFIKHLPSEKNHLYKTILKSLRNYYSETSVASSLKQEIKNIEILYNKGLFQECMKFLERAKKIAVQYEKFYYWFELIAWEKTLLEESFENGRFGDLDSLIREEQDVLNKLQNLTAYHVLYSKINYVFRSGGYSRSEEDTQIINEIAEHPLIIGKNTALSHRAATICYYTQGFCSLAIGNTEVALEKYLRVKNILDEHTHIRADLAKRYIRTLSQIIHCLLDLKRFNEAYEFLQMLKHAGELEGFETQDAQSRIHSEHVLCELKRYIFLGKFAEGAHAMTPVMEEIRSSESTLHKEIVLRMYYYLAYLHFGSGSPNKALQWLNRVTNDNENDLRQDVYSYARLFNLVIHYELGNSDLLEYTIKSTSRYLQKRMRDFKMEKLILDQFKKLIHIRSSSAKKEQIDTFQIEMDQLIRVEDNRALMRYFDFTVWLTSKREGISFSESFDRIHNT
jgi:hypothetical protein